MRETGERIEARKARHLEVCLDETRYQVESGETRLNEVHLVHHALPELHADQIDTTTTFLGHAVRLPLFISSMTGGSEAAYAVNKALASVAQRIGIPVGMGSIRILFRKPQVIDHFRLKRYAPDVPVFANIGAVQLPQLDHNEIYTLLSELEVDGIAVHLNPAQELAQEGGDHDFRGITTALKRFCHHAPVPVIVKETGMGIHPVEIEKLFRAGASYVDVAGGGGTNWMRVESERTIRSPSVSPFDRWGIPTALALSAAKPREGLLASGEFGPAAMLLLLWHWERTPLVSHYRWYEP